METFKYLLKRVNIIFYSVFFSKFKIDNNIYYRSTTNAPKTKKVFFYFPDATLMHLGDHLFFEPLCNLFRKNGYAVEILPSTIMKEYFNQLGYSLNDKKGLLTNDLIISSSRFLPEIVKLDNDFLLIETECPDIQKALIDDILEKVTVLFKMEKVVTSIPSYIYNHTNVRKKYNLDEHSKYIIFSNYLVSGSFRVFDKKHKKLEEAVVNFKYKYPDFKVIHIGSSTDLKNDTKNYDFVDIDLRGKTTVMELFEISNLDEVVLYMGFDNFLMHLFFILNKDVKIMSRGRWSNKSRFFLENYIDPPFDIKYYEGNKQYIR
jgi:hypothetical protein